MARDPFKPNLGTPIIVRIVIGVLLVAVVGLFAVYALQSGRSSADDARTAVAIGKMDEAQSEANARRDARRSADSLLN